MARVLVIGGYGNFGARISRALAEDRRIELVIAGRSKGKADALARELGATAAELDINAGLAESLRRLRPDLVVHTSGPFQGQGYGVAEACIAEGAHYLDLADSRAFVAGIGALDDAARAAGVAVIAGASSVPALTAAVIDQYRPRFATIERIRYGISTATAGAQGRATAAGVLSYVGKPFLAWENGRAAKVYGWQGLHGVRYPEIGTRLFGDCDIPDLSLFPQRYPGLRQLRFAAGHEVKLLHLGTWAMSWLVRWGMIGGLAPWADRLLDLSRWFDPLGTGRSGFHMILSGRGADAGPLEIRFFLIARQHHGPHIPCVPAILLARRLAAGESFAPGARACLDLVSLDAYLAALADLDVVTHVEARTA